LLAHDLFERRLNHTPLSFRGLAYEGAAMGLMLAYVLTPWSASRLQTFLLAPGTHHSYMIHVGVGWAMARVPWGLRKLKHVRAADAGESCEACRARIRALFWCERSLCAHS
jgi:hypothetical protein